MHRKECEAICLDAINKNDIKKFNENFNYTLYHGIRNTLIRAYKLLFLLFTKKMTEYYSLLEMLSDEDRNSPYIKVVLEAELDVQILNEVRLTEILKNAPVDLMFIISWGIDCLSKLKNKNMRKEDENKLKGVIADCYKNADIFEPIIN